MRDNTLLELRIRLVHLVFPTDWKRPTPTAVIVGKEKVDMVDESVKEVKAEDAL